MEGPSDGMEPRPALAPTIGAGMLLKLVYWLAVLAVSIVLVIGLILWFESQDESRIEGSSVRPAALVS